MTIPKVIASGETITIPAGRIAILPNVQIDGVLNGEGEVFIPSGATLGDLDSQLALKANTADLKEIGVGQTWQDVTASRVADTTYTNSTGKPILVNVSTASTTAGSYATAIVGVVTLKGSVGGSGGGWYPYISFVVPNGITYSCSNSSGSPTINGWSELR